MPLTTKNLCTSQSSCKAGEMCVNVLGSVKHCCPVPDNLKCHKTQFPFYKRGATNCQQGSTKQASGSCCQDYIYKVFGDASPIKPPGTKECTKDSCANGEFCGASTLSNMAEYVQGSPKHCYKRPVRGDGKASLVNGELVLCPSDTHCRGILIHSCKKVTEYNDKQLCFESNCPLWLKTGLIDSSKFSKACTSDSACPNGLCTSLFGNEKRCCPIEPTLTCPGGVLPVMGAGNKPLTACDASKHFVHSVGGLKLCCDKPHSKDFEALGEISPRDDSETCKKNEDCIKGENGYFCGVSLIDGARIKVEGYAITDPIRHCYKRPSFQNRWAMIRLENQELEDCEKAEDCRTNNPAICEKGTLDRKTTRKICFEKQCPFTAPLTSKATCSAQSSCKAGQMCVNVIGSVKHCCPVPDDFKCHTSQLPYKPGSTECKDGSKAHTKQTGFCCQDYIYKGTGDSSPVAPVRPQECTKESECGKGEFCGASTLAKMGEYLQGSPRHCYKRPVRGDGKASLVTGDLVFCTADTDCPGSLIKSCKPDSNYKPNICFESNCPLWLEKNPIDSSKYSQLCYNKPSACSLGSHCVSLLTNEKRCCPVEPTFLCPGGNLPVLGGDDKPLTTCDSTIHFVHTAGQTKLCCDMPIAKYLHDVNGETVLSKNEKVPCSTNTQCGGGYFCAESLTKGSKKAFKVKVMHCYKQPVDGELIPGNGQSGLVICEKHEGCDVAKGQFCYNKFAHLKKGLCYKATCPLGGLPSGKFQACSKKSECGDNHCHPVNDKKYSGCCTVDTGNLCPGGIPPIELWKTECKGTNVFSRTIKNIPVCCIHVVSKKMKATGTLWRLTEKESDDIAAMNAKLCKTSGAVCPAGFFCDESVPLEGASLDVKPAVKHCYPVPKTHGASVAGPPTVLTTCTDSKECTGGQICDNKISLLDSRIKNTAGVCSVFKCPLSPSDTIRPTSFSKGINLCSTSADCGSGKHCHPVGSGNHYKACCDVAPQFLCPAGIPPIELWKTECKGANVFSRTINNIPVCCLHVVSKKMKATGTLWRLTEKGSDDIPAMDAKLCKTSGDICDAGFFCDESVPLEGDSLGVAVKHCYPVPKTHGISVAGPPAQLTTCTDSKECTGGQICDNKISLLDNRIKNTAGVCSVFKCPLSTSHINRPTSFSKGINLCSSLADCESGKHCHPVGSGQHYKACCDIAPEFLCPAGIPPTELWNSECKGENIFSRVLNSVPACCLRVVSKTMKATGTLWHLAEEESEEIAAMELRVCRTSGDICDAGFFCDESVSMEGGDLGVKHCYPVPKTHGVSVVGPPTQLTTCTDSKECTGGQICDNKISLLDNRIKNTAGVCSTFKCPLSSSYISRPSSFSEGIDLCSSATACESGKACHPIGSGELYKACCDVADEYLCPGGLFPTKVQKKMYYTEGDIMCDAGTFQYKWGTGDTPADGARCCPKVVSLDFLVEPVRSDETCQKNSDCQADEFCGTSTLEKNLSNPKTLEVNGVRVHHCYKSPKCSGTTVLSPNIGLKTCAKEYNTCDTDQICDLDLGATNQGRFAGKSGVCCHFQCSGSVPEGKAGDVGKPGKVCSCKGETKAQAFCDEDLQNDENTINVCEATGVEGTYRQCTYAREALKCFGEYEGPLRRKGSFEVVPCSNHVVCQGASKEIDGGASLCTSPLNPSTIPKICCKADLCPDHFTFRGNQDTCTNDGDCSKTEGSQQLKAKCQGDILGKSTAKHCCPFTDNVGRIEVVYPFDTKTHCTSLGDCLGDNRFCDSAKSTCIYNWRAADERKKSGSCTKDQMVCGGDKRVVCMTTELADTSSEPECFRHPFDECEKNKQCPFSGLSAGYCAPAVGTSEAEYAKAFRRCHTVPMGAAYLQLGLKECKDAADCTMDQSCIKDPAVATTPGFGYCKRNFEMTCRGSPQIDDSNGEVFTCSKNIDCGENGFCDMDITRPQSIPQDKGICCSRPICGGDLVLKEAGVKICTDDTGCSTEGGEICVKDIEKPENSAWKAGEGVCCKGTCPNIQHPEASVDVVPAGPICVANNCQNTTDTIRMCVGGTNVTFQRCCSYPRKTNICPAEFNGPVRNGFDAKPCATTKDCPAASECSGGFCCTQTFCSDKKTVKTAQLKCSKKSAEKDCRQPSGAVATCEKGRCCPKTHESKILEPFVTTTRCRHARDCPFNKMFCETSTRNCTYFGNNLKALETDKNCERGNLTCVGRDNLMGVCLYPDDNRNNLPSCYLNPMSESRIQENTEGDVDESAMVLGSILGIVAMALATVGLGGTLLAGYYKISKKNVRDKMRKAEKALNKDRKKKKPKKEELTGQSELWKNETSQSKVEQSQSQVDQSQMSQVESRASKKSGKSVKE